MLIDRIIASASRRLCLGADEFGDFRSWVHLELIQADYRILSEFGGRSSFATYLTAVIQNLARDYRMKHWGRWRTSAAAERLGLTAMRLEAFLYRDGFSFDEATENLRANHGVKMSRAEIADLAGQIPPRVRLRFDDEAGLKNATADSRADQQTMDTERKRTLARAQQVLALALGELSVEDRLVLKMHYQSGLTLSAVARTLDRPQRELYTRKDRSLTRLKERFLKEGLGAEDVLGALGYPDGDFEVAYGENQAELGETGPSNSVNPQDEGDSRP